MKKITTYIIFLGLFISSCNDFLSVDPEVRAKLNTPQDVSDFLTSAYPTASYFAFTETMTDNVGDVGTWGFYLDFIDQAYWWKDFTSQSQDTPSAYFYTCYNAISTANDALQTCYEKFDTTTCRAQIGEALLCRAYAHFMLVNIFSPTYNPQTASSDLALPYVTEVETDPFKSYERVTVQKMYDLIEADLVKGIEYIGEAEFKSPKYHFGISSAATFASRFFLYRQKWDKAIEYANIALGVDDAPRSLLRDWNGKYQNLQVDVLLNTYNSSQEDCNLVVNSDMSYWEIAQRAVRYKFNTPILNEMYNNRNVTGGEIAYTFIGGTEQSLRMAKFKYYFKRLSSQSPNGYYYIIHPIITIEEALINRAEAYAMLGDQVSIDAAIRDLNIFYSKRIKDYNASSHLITQVKIDAYAKNTLGNKELSPNYQIPEQSENLLKVIVDTRRKEFLNEGLRWFDIRRFDMVVTHMSSDGKMTDTLQKGDFRKTMQLPSQVINAGMEPNPREILVRNPDSTSDDFIMNPDQDMKPTASDLMVRIFSVFDNENVKQ